MLVLQGSVQFVKAVVLVWHGSSTRDEEPVCDRSPFGMRSPLDQFVRCLLYLVYIAMKLSEEQPCLIHFVLLDLAADPDIG
jgi:hypothetical protein